MTSLRMRRASSVSCVNVGREAADLSARRRFDRPDQVFNHRVVCFLESAATEHHDEQLEAERGGSCGERRSKAVHMEQSHQLQSSVGREGLLDTHISHSSHCVCVCVCVCV